MLYPRMNAHREKLELSGFWQFTVDPDRTGEGKGWQGSFPHGRLIAVPGSFNEQFQNEDFPGVDIKNHVGVVWYQTKFFVPLSWLGRRIWIRVGGAFYSSKVWVNGILSGENSGGYYPIDFDITGQVTFGEENLLVISVDSELGPLTMPPGTSLGVMEGSYPKVAMDYFPYGGIHRPVFIYTTPMDYIRDITVSTDISEADGIIRYSVDTVGDAGSVRVSLEEIPGVEEAGTGSGCLRVENARLWGPGDPYLYHMKVELLRDDQVADSYIQTVGIRTIRVENGQILLNGEPVFLRGIGKHEDAPILGKGVYPAQIVKDYSLLRWLGANSWRCVHYTYSEEAMDMADREGMLVLGEVSATGLDWSLLTPEMLEVHKEAIRRTIQRDKNRPSVIMWVLANESADWKNDDFHKAPPPEVEGYFKEVCDYARSLDDRPVCIPDCTFRGEMLHAHCDVVGLNRYVGWYQLSGRLDEAMEALEKDLERYHSLTGKPIMITEFGADAVAGMHYDPPEMWSEEYQAEMLERVIRLAESKPYIIGTFIWAFADFKTSQMLRRIICNHKGIFTRDRQPKLAAHVVKRVWAELDKTRKLSLDQSGIGE